MFVSVAREVKAKKSKAFQGRLNIVKGLCLLALFLVRINYKVDSHRRRRSRSSLSTYEHYRGTPCWLLASHFPSHCQLVDHLSAPLVSWCGSVIFTLSGNSRSREDPYPIRYNPRIIANLCEKQMKSHAIAAFSEIGTFEFFQICVKCVSSVRHSE